MLKTIVLMEILLTAEMAKVDLCIAIERAMEISQVSKFTSHLPTSQITVQFQQA